jgi:glyoxylase-like metal-dependent hydrolase (beta-lactamase superfamily II)
LTTRSGGSPPVRLRLPTPLAIDHVNCWLLEGAPLTLVDAGPFAESSVAELEAALTAQGVRLDEVELLLLTHQHVDHIGNAAALVERTGCRVAAHRLVAEFAADLEGALEVDDAFRDEILALNGATAERRAAYWSTQELRNACWSGSFYVDCVLEEGDTLEAGGRTLRTALRPGHSPTDTVFFDDRGGIAISGDHLLADGSPTPIITRPIEGPVDPRTRPAPLQEYVTSLLRSTADDARLWLPGHGDVVSDHRALIRERREGIRRKTGRIAAMVGRRPVSALELADALWPQIDVALTYVVACEVLGALDLLLHDGRVQLHDGETLCWRRI